MTRLIRLPLTFTSNFRPSRHRKGVCVQCKLAVGIDLGTTNSAVSVLRDGIPVIVPNSNGQNTTPSYVSYLPNGEIHVGDGARKRAARYPKTTFSSVKRLVGKDYETIMDESLTFGFEIEKADDNQTILKCDHLPEGILRPIDVSAEIIRFLLKSVHDVYDEDVTRCVISVPAYFNEMQREATVAAGLLAGLEKVRLIQEPVASALAYGLDLQHDQTVCVFDLGGGTLDICILELGRGVAEVLATGGNSRLGGDDFDAAIVNWLIADPLSSVPGVRKTAKFMRNLKQLAEAAKIKLSSSRTVRLEIPVKGENVKIELTRNHLEKLSNPLFTEMRSALDRCCWQAGVDLLQIRDRQKNSPMQIRIDQRQPVSEILLVGAATKMPAVGRFLKNMTDITVRESKVDPDLCVAMGAAIEAGRLGGELSEDFMMMDVWQASLMRALAKEQLKDMSSD